MDCLKISDDLSLNFIEIDCYFDVVNLQEFFKTVFEGTLQFEENKCIEFYQFAKFFGNSEIVEKIEQFIIESLVRCKFSRNLKFASEVLCIDYTEEMQEKSNGVLYVWCAKNEEYLDYVLNIPKAEFYDF